MHIQCMRVYNAMLIFFIIYIINMATAAYNYTKSNQLRFAFHFNYTSPVSITIAEALYGSPHKNGTYQRMTKKAHLSMV